VILTTGAFLMSHPNNNALRLSCFAILAAIIAGCGSSSTTVQETDAVRLLQLDQPQEALDLLSKVEDSGSGEIHYLRALAFERLHNADAARTEINLALKIDENPKFQGLKLRQRLFEKDASAIDEIIELYDKHSSTPEIVVYAMYAFDAKSVQLRAEGKIRSSNVHRKSVIQCVQTCVSMSDEIREFQHELVAFSLRVGLAADARSLIDQLLRLDPKNSKLARDKIAVYLLTNDTGGAVYAAKRYYKDQRKTEDSALIYAGVLVKSKANEPRDDEFRSLVKTFPFNRQITEKYAVYLSQDGRADAACRMIEPIIDSMLPNEERSKLLRTTLDIALNQDVDFAISKLNKYRSDIDDPLLLNFYEARIIYQQTQHEAALKKLAKVAEEGRAGNREQRALAGQALTWMQHIMANQLKNEFKRPTKKEVQQVNQPTKKPKVRFATDDDSVAEDESAEKPTPNDASKNDESINDSPAKAKAAQQDGNATR